MRVRSNNRRKRNKRFPTGRIRVGEWMQCLANHDYCCALCSKTGRSHITLDHKISLHNGGTNTIENVQPLCVKCHETKDGHVRHTWWFFRRYYRKIRWWLRSRLGIQIPDYTKRIPPNIRDN